jgi:hypothetical protein
MPRIYRDDFNPVDHLVVHCKKEKYDVYIGRPSKWGNQFRIKQRGNLKARHDAVYQYWIWVHAQPDFMREIRRELNGKVLGCWCQPEFCHGHVIARIANPELYQRLERIHDGPPVW